VADRIKGPRVEVHRRPHPDAVAAVLSLADAAAAADGVEPLGEATVLALRRGSDGEERHLLVIVPDETAGDRTVGYAYLDPGDPGTDASTELAIHPAHRRRGYGRALLEAVAAAAPGGRLRVWAHGDRPEARALAAATGFTEIRRLLQLRRSLVQPLPDVRLPDDVRLRSFRPGQDEGAWLALNALAFASHPEQGRWTGADLAARMAESWFDPDGFLIATRDDAMVGYHWTKIHKGEPAGPGQTGDGGPIGEVYVLGVHPAYQGGGLGRGLTIAGLQWLRGHGLGRAMLYVEGDNEPALAVYSGLGFAPWRTDVMYRREGTRKPQSGE
jgi:mycothiol synthase